MISKWLLILFFILIACSLAYSAENILCSPEDQIFRRKMVMMAPRIKLYSYENLRLRELIERKQKRRRIIKIGASVLISAIIFGAIYKYRKDIQKAKNFGRTRKWFRLVLLLPGDDELAQYEQIEKGNELKRSTILEPLIPLKKKK